MLHKWTKSIGVQWWSSRSACRSHSHTDPLATMVFPGDSSILDARIYRKKGYYWFSNFLLWLISCWAELKCDRIVAVERRGRGFWAMASPSSEKWNLQYSLSDRLTGTDMACIVFSVWQVDRYGYGLYSGSGLMHSSYLTGKRRCSKCVSEHFWWHPRDWLEKILC